MVTVDGDGTTVVFKQIAGLIARRIVFTKKPGDTVATGERVGMIKFGSRVDVLFGPEWEIVVQPGMHVAGVPASSRGAPISRRRTLGSLRNWRMPSLRTRSSTAIRPTGGRARAAYALPTLFTAGNIFLGYLSILRSFQGAMLAAAGAAGAARRISRSRPWPSARPCCWTGWTAASRA